MMQAAGLGATMASQPGALPHASAPQAALEHWFHEHSLDLAPESYRHAVIFRESISTCSYDTTPLRISTATIVPVPRGPRPRHQFPVARLVLCSSSPNCMPLPGLTSAAA
eukprot:464348-Amphidinium_carterae.2